MADKPRNRSDTVPHYDLRALRRNLESVEANIALCLEMGWRESLEGEIESKMELLALIKEIEDGDAEF